ncbi:ATP-binding protein [Reyranella sp.]|uniref:ATP-binding protein n=1 Tax=Reyranella sp. TaxID=1929291 RepID=UPI003D10EB14
MSRFWRLLSLDSISRQITVLLAVAIVGGSIITTMAVLLVLSDQDYPTAAATAPVRVATVLSALQNLPRPLRQQVVSRYAEESLRIRLDGQPSAGGDLFSPSLEMLKTLMTQYLPANTQLLYLAEHQPNIVTIVARLGDGQTVMMEARYSKISLLSAPLLVPLILLAVSAILLSIWAARQVAAPLSRFAAAADQFGRDGATAPLDERGPAEISRASHAFNRMRERIARLIEDRTNLLLAISHDLRTPLTRLRLRIAELAAGDEALKHRGLDDIAAMESSITAAVTYLREGNAEEPVERVELVSMLGTICDQFSDLGHSVEYVGPARLALTCRPRAMDRAVTNLVDNASKYGSHIQVVLSQGADQISIEVRDDGPGIPDDEKPRVIKPFYRSDPARQGVRGFGLGLAIVTSIVQAEGGTFTLLDNEPRGLRALITLPA